MANKIPFNNNFKYGLLGPAIILLAFGQATGELIHWPYLIVKYKYYFLFLLVPACIMQYPILYFLGRHTIITGETFLSTLLKSNKIFALLTWVIFLFTTIWISSYTNSGGIGIAKFINKYFGFNLNQEIWGNYIALIINTFYFFILVFTRKSTFRIVNAAMRFIAIASLVVFIFLIVYSLFIKPFNMNFLLSLFEYKINPPSNWNSRDIKIVISAVVFAGLGGLWNLLYSSWVRNQKMGMAANSHDEYIDYQNELLEIENSSDNDALVKKNMNLLNKDLLVGISLNFIMLLMLSYVCSVFWPYNETNPSPNGLAIITILADTVSYAFQTAGVLFYLFIGLFLVDTWLTAADSLSKVHTNFLVGLFPQINAKAASSSLIYFISLSFMWIMTIVTSYIAQPQTFLYLNGILSAIGSVVLIVGIAFNENFISKKYKWLRANKYFSTGLFISFLFYILFVYLYFIN